MLERAGAWVGSLSAPMPAHGTGRFLLVVPHSGGISPVTCHVVGNAALEVAVAQERDQMSAAMRTSRQESGA